MYLIPEVAHYLLWACTDRRPTASPDGESSNHNAADAAYFEQHLARLRPRCFLRTVYSESPNDNGPAKPEMTAGEPLHLLTHVAGRGT
jgi:hypothetical protein